MAGQRVVVTGAFGNVGLFVLRELVSRGHRVRAFDRPTRLAARRAAGFGDRVEVLWGDVRDADAVERAVGSADAVAHLAFVLPRLSETDPELSRAVNVEGSRNVVEACRRASPSPRLVFASSYAVWGETRDLDGLLGPDSPVRPVSSYSRQKAEVEEMVRASGLRACVLRLGAVLSAETVLGGRIDPLIFDLPYDARQELLHSEDAARAVAGCLDQDEVWGRTLPVGGGPSCQLLYGDLINRTLGAMGLSPLPPEAFSLESRQGGGWMDSSEAERLLGYQRWSFDDHLADLALRAGARRHAARLLAPLVRWYVVRQSPYLKGRSGS